MPCYNFAFKFHHHHRINNKVSNIFKLPLLPKNFAVKIIERSQNIVKFQLFACHYKGSGPVDQSTMSTRSNR